MERLTSEDLQALIGSRPESCVSIYMPMVRAGREVQQNPIRYRNLLDTAERQAREQTEGWGDLLAHGRGLLDREDIWGHPGDGLAVLFDRRELRVFRADTAFQELVSVSTRFHLKPLLGLLADDQRFHLLDLNRHHVRLFRGTRDGVHEMHSGNLPGDYREVVGRDREQQHLQFHTGSGSAGGERDARFHGQGGGDDDVEGELRRFVAELEPAVREALGNSRAPLLLAGLEPMPALYREKNHYPHLAEQEIHRNIGNENAETVHRIVWPVVERLLKERVEREAERVRALLGGERASADLADVVAAADDGRVKVLFVARGVQRWGRYEQESRRVFLHEEPQAGSDDLLDLAAARTFVCGGRVLVVDPESVPGPPEAVASAVFRYPGPGAGPA